MVTDRAKYPNIPRRVSGYNLNYLLPENGFHVARALVGTEGTCVTTLEATCRLVESPPERVLLAIGCRDVFEAADLVPEVLLHKPIALKGWTMFSSNSRAASESIPKAWRSCRQAEDGCWLNSEERLCPTRIAGGASHGISRPTCKFGELPAVS